MTAVVHNKACSHVTDQQDPESFWNHLVPRLQVLQTNVQISVYLDWFQPNLETWKPPWTLEEQYVKLSLLSCQAAAVFAEHVLDTSALVISSSSNTGEIQVLPTRTHHEGKRCCNTSVVSTGWRLVVCLSDTKSKDVFHFISLHPYGRLSASQQKAAAFCSCNIGRA